MNFIFASTLQYTQSCSFSVCFLGNTFLKDTLVMQDKTGEKQKPFSTSSMQLCPRCIFCFKGAVKIGSGHRADTQPWTLKPPFPDAELAHQLC